MSNTPATRSPSITTVALAALAALALCSLAYLAFALPWPASVLPGVAFVVAAFYIGKSRTLAEWVWVRIPVIGAAIAIVLAVGWFAIWG